MFLVEDAIHWEFFHICIIWGDEVEIKCGGWQIGKYYRHERTQTWQTYVLLTWCYTVFLQIQMIIQWWRHQFSVGYLNCFSGMVDRRKVFSLLSRFRSSVRDPHHHKSPTRREQDLNLRRTWVEALLCSSDNHYTTAQIL